MNAMLQSKMRLKLFLGIIVLIAAFLRFYSISTIPVSLYWDETASAYNAYSIAMTGKDEYGIVFPLLFRSFDDYKAPGMTYLTSIAIKIFGLNEFSARVSSSVAGTLTVLVVFFLVKELILLHEKNEVVVFKKKIPLSAETIGILTAGMLAISPWHIQFSRTGFEANIALACTVVGVWLFLRSLRIDNKRNYFIAMALFAGSFYFYRSTWVFLPLLLVGLFFFLRKQLFNKKRLRNSVLGILLFFLVLAPFIPVMFSSQALLRSREAGVFTTSDDALINAAKLRMQGGINKIIYNQRIIYAEIIMVNYMSNFSPQFLFVSGDPNGRHGVQGMGVLYYWEIPFMLLGLYIVIRKTSRPVCYIILAWILIAPIPAALSTPNPHALRSLNILPMPQLLTAIGIYIAFYLFTKKWRKIYLICLSLVIVLFFSYYMYLYYIITPKITSADWADGYKQLTQYMIPREAKYDKLIVTGHYWKPYIYFLLYKQYSPAMFQNEHGNEYHFANYLFTGTRWGNQPELDNVNVQQFAHAQHLLVAMSPSEWNTQKKTLHYLTTIKDNDNNVIFIVADTK